MTYIDPVAARSSAAFTLHRLLAELARQGHGVSLFYSPGLSDYGSDRQDMAKRLASIRTREIVGRERARPFRLLFRLPGLSQLPDRSIVNHSRMVQTVLGEFGPGAVRHHDVCLSWSKLDSIHLAARAVVARTRLPWIAFLSDPWADHGHGYGDYAPLVAFVNRRLEASVISRADGVVFTTEETRDVVMDKYPPAWRDKTYCFVTGYDAELYGDAPAPRGGPVVIKYLGAFYGERSPEPLFRGMRKLFMREPEWRARVVVEFIGHGEAMLHSLVERYGFADIVRIYPPVPYVQSLREMQDADVLLSLDAPTERNIFLPSKLVDYLGTGNLIWCIARPGPSAKFAAQYGGVVSDVADPDGIADDLATIVCRVTSAERPARRSPPADCSIQASAGRFVEILDGCRAAHGKRSTP